MAGEAPVKEVFKMVDGQMVSIAKLWKNPKKTGQGFTISGKNADKSVMFILNSAWAAQNRPAQLVAAEGQGQPFNVVCELVSATHPKTGEVFQKGVDSVGGVWFVRDVQAHTPPPPPVASDAPPF